MADFDSEDLLDRFKDEAGLPEASEYTDTQLYRRLSDGQRAVIREIAARYPKCLYQAPAALTPSGDRTTFTFGADPNDPTRDIMPIGTVQIASSLSAFSGDTFAGWVEGIDFLDEGTRIRIPAGRSWSGTLYGRWVPTPPSISDSVQPILLPAEARVLIVTKAVELFAGEGDQHAELAARMERRWAKDFPVWMLTFRKRFQGGGALVDPARWWLSSPDLAN